MWRSARDAEGQLDGVRHFVLRLTRHDAEVAALDAEGAADDQQVAFQARNALAELVFQVSEFDWHGDVLRNTLEGERAGHVSRGRSPVGLYVLDLLGLEGDFRVLRSDARR